VEDLAVMLVPASRVMTTVLWAAQQGPIIVDVSKPHAPAPDISVEVVLGMFAMTGVLLAVAALGGAIVALAIVLYMRRRDASTESLGPSHTQLKL
jgi:hypothetical protein